MKFNVTVSCDTGSWPEFLVDRKKISFPTGRSKSLTDINASGHFHA